MAECESKGVRCNVSNKPGLSRSKKTAKTKLPKKKKYDSSINHAPFKNYNLSKDERELAVKNALRYFPQHQHKTLIKEFKKGVTISPDSMGEGTNCMICTTPDILKFKYGPGSCLAHMELAHREGIQVRLYRSKRLEFDIDRDSDLTKLIKKSGYTKALDYIKSIQYDGT